jgi:hypothetical protein
MNNTEKDAIKKVIEKAYIQGIHTTQDEGEVKSGFHSDFAMLVLQKDELEKVDVDLWLERVETMKANNPEMWSAETTYTFDMIDIAGSAAVAKLNVHKGPVHFSTDYMLLYKFEDGWKIVSKIFSVPK